MTDHVYTLLEITESSPTSFDDAVEVALEQGSAPVHSIELFEVTEIREQTESGRIRH